MASEADMISASGYNEEPPGLYADNMISSFLKSVDFSTIFTPLPKVSSVKPNFASSVLFTTFVATGTAVTIPLGNGALSASHYLTNPTAGNHTFYARILTFTTAAGAQQYASGNIDNTGANAVVDAGGIALSTANQLLITAKVQERLSFCVYSGSCTADTAGAARTTGITLGNTNGVLDPTGPYVDKNAKFDISTNALNGAFVVLKGDTLKTGSFDITAIGGTAASSALGTEQFGMCLYQSAGSGLDVTAGTVGNSTYNNANCSTTTQTAGTGATGGVGTAQFGFNTTNTLAAAGDTIAKKPAGSTSTATLAFIGNIANTTEAGIYTTTLTLIATGSY